MDPYDVEVKKLAAAEALLHYSPFVLTCIGEGVSPSQLRLHLLKEVSGMPSSLINKQPIEEAEMEDKLGASDS